MEENQVKNKENSPASEKQYIRMRSQNKNVVIWTRNLKASTTMFNFIKKGVSVSDRDREKTDRDKERRKKDKKLRKDSKQNIAGNMSSEELLRLDEVSVHILC